MKKDLARADEVLIFPETGLVTGVRKIQEKPDELKRMIWAGIKANRTFAPIATARCSS